MFRIEQIDIRDGSSVAREATSLIIRAVLGGETDHDRHLTEINPNEVTYAVFNEADVLVAASEVLHGARNNAGDSVSYIQTMAVLEGYRGGIYGKGLLAYIAHRALGNEDVQVRLQTDTRRIRALEHLGFTYDRDELMPVGIETVKLIQRLGASSSDEEP